MDRDNGCSLLQPLGSPPPSDDGCGSASGRPAPSQSRFVAGRSATATPLTTTRSKSREFPGNETYDLILVSEIGYYWCWRDLARAFLLARGSLRPGGHLLLVHWTAPSADKPLSGFEVHEAVRSWAAATGDLQTLCTKDEGLYRMDLYERRMQG